MAWVMPLPLWKGRGRRRKRRGGDKRGMKGAQAKGVL